MSQAVPSSTFYTAAFPELFSAGPSRFAHELGKTERVFFYVQKYGCITSQFTEQLDEKHFRLQCVRLYSEFRVAQMRFRL